VKEVKEAHNCRAVKRRYEKHLMVGAQVSSVDELGGQIPAEGWSYKIR